MDEVDHIKQELLKTWDLVESNFKQAITKQQLDLPIIYTTIMELRKRGFDQKFWAGQSLWSFCLSRSRKSGLETESSGIKIAPGGNLWNAENGAVRIFFSLNSNAKSDFTTSNPIESTKFMNLLAELEKEPID